MKNINYLYFGCYFLFLSLLAAGNIFTKDPFGDSKFFFFLYALGQIGVEVVCLLAIGEFLKRKKRPVIFYTFIGLTFFLFVLHVLDTAVNRILDLSIWDAISLFVIRETWENFRYLLDATGLPLWIWAIFFFLFALIPLAGAALYFVTNKICARWPLSLPMQSVTMSLICLPAALFFWDFSASSIIHPNTYTALVQSLPWKTTFLHPENIQLEMASSLKPLPETEAIAQEIASWPSLTYKPNIYLFIVESFRSDVIDGETTPHLFAFQQESAPFQATFANGNASHLSWFSIFHSQFSYYWHLAQMSHKAMGSPALALLKHLGYKIHLYSSAQLGYYGMDTLLFGKNLQLLDSAHYFPHPSPLSAADTDAKAVQTLMENLKKEPSLQEGQVFIVFWDSTHFDYSWPKEWTPKFTPFASELAYFTALYSKNQQKLIKNRYKNAAHYLDHLFGKFYANLPHREDAIVVVTGDHGEEFCEHGHLFHGSHLIAEQVKVPLFIKLGSRSFSTPRDFASQMDIFPSIIDHLCEKTASFFQGESIQRPMSWKFALSSRFNAGSSPYEFCLNNGKYKLIGRFNHPNNLLQSQKVQIVSLQDAQDKNISTSSQNIHPWIEREFGAAWHKLFQDR